jgi:hypothetical protein
VRMGQEERASPVGLLLIERTELKRRRSLLNEEIKQWGAKIQPLANDVSQSGDTDARLRLTRMVSFGS